jgi:hypothetical protein
MREEDFESKGHITKHLSLNRFGVIEEVSEVNSAEENDYLNWKLFLARTLVPANTTPFGLKMIVDGSDKWRKAYKSYAFGVIKQLKAKWIWIAVAVVGGVIALLYFTGRLG